MNKITPILLSFFIAHAYGSKPAPTPSKPGSSSTDQYVPPTIIKGKEQKAFTINGKTQSMYAHIMEATQNPNTDFAKNCVTVFASNGSMKSHFRNILDLSQQIQLAQERKKIAQSDENDLCEPYPTREEERIEIYLQRLESGDFSYTTQQNGNDWLSIFTNATPDKPSATDKS